MNRHFRLKNLENNQLFTLRQSQMMLGRNNYCDIHIDSGLLSRQHAEIRVENGQVLIEDLNSTNGTFVNNMRIEAPTSLMHGDVVTVGHDRFMLIAPDKNDGSTVFTYNMSQSLDDAEEDDVAVAHTKLQKAFPSPLGWQSMSSPKTLDEQEINKLLQGAVHDEQFDAHVTPVLLIVRSGGNQGEVYELSVADNPEKAKWSIGRGQFMDVIVDYPTVSNHHADITFDGEQWRIVDKESTNGVKVNSRRVVDSGCNNGDLLTLGSLDVIFKVI